MNNKLIFTVLLLSTSSGTLQAGSGKENINEKFFVQLEKRKNSQSKNILVSDFIKRNNFSYKNYFNSILSANKQFYKISVNPERPLPAIPTTRPVAAHIASINKAIDGSKTSAMRPLPAIPTTRPVAAHIASINKAIDGSKTSAMRPLPAIPTTRPVAAHIASINKAINTGSLAIEPEQEQAPMAVGKNGTKPASIREDTQLENTNQQELNPAFKKSLTYLDQIQAGNFKLKKVEQSKSKTDRNKISDNKMGAFNDPIVQKMLEANSRQEANVLTENEAEWDEAEIIEETIVIATTFVPRVLAKFDKSVDFTSPASETPDTTDIESVKLSKLNAPIVLNSISLKALREISTPMIIKKSLTTTDAAQVDLMEEIKKGIILKNNCDRLPKPLKPQSQTNFDILAAALKGRNAALNGNENNNEDEDENNYWDENEFPKAKSSKKPFINSLWSKAANFIKGNKNKDSEHKTSKKAVDLKDTDLDNETKMLSIHTSYCPKIINTKNSDDYL